MRIRASGVNPLDTKIRAGKAAHAKQRLPAVLGLDMAGVVEEVGAAVTAFRPGDEVYGMVGGVGGLQGTLADLSPPTRICSPSNQSPSPCARPPLSVNHHHGVGRHRRSCQSPLRPEGARPRRRRRSRTHHRATRKGFRCRGIRHRLHRQATRSRTVRCNPHRLPHTFHRTIRRPAHRRSGLRHHLRHRRRRHHRRSFAAVKRYTGHVVSSLGWSTHSLAPLSFRGATYSGVFYAHASAHRFRPGTSRRNPSRSSSTR